MSANSLLCHARNILSSTAFFLSYLHPLGYTRIVNIADRSDMATIMQCRENMPFSTTFNRDLETSRYILVADADAMMEGEKEEGAI